MRRARLLRGPSGKKWLENVGIEGGEKEGPVRSRRIGGGSEDSERRRAAGVPRVPQLRSDECARCVTKLIGRPLNPKALTFAYTFLYHLRLYVLITPGSSDISAAPPNPRPRFITASLARGRRRFYNCRRVADVTASPATPTRWPRRHRSSRCPGTSLINPVILPETTKRVPRLRRCLIYL